MGFLSVAVDIYDDILQRGVFFDERQLRGLMGYCRSLGATTVDWVYDDMWAFYDDYPGGMDLLGTAAKAAHGEGLEFSVVYKPFEGALTGIVLPHTAPRPAGVPVWDALTGLVPVVRPFAVDHPEFCLQRQPSDADPGGAIREIRLVKRGAEPVALTRDQVSIWTGTQNGRLEPWVGDFSLSSEVAWRPLFPLGESCRVVRLTGLDIPAEERFVEVRLSDEALAGGEFRCDYEQLVEVENDRGEAIAACVAAAEHPRDVYAGRLAQAPYPECVRYARHPEVRTWLADEAQMARDCRDLAAYGREVGDPVYRLDERRKIAFARGKEPYLRGILNPVYPEVRAEWLSTIERLIDAGADVVDVRSSSHLNQQELWAYGFNPPVMEALGGEENVAGAGRVMGDAYTGFLEEARVLLHGRGKQLGVHLLTNFVKTRDEGMAKPSHEIMAWQWQRWVAEIADRATLRGAMGLRWESLQYAVDLFGDACRQRGIPLIYQSNRRYYVGRLDDTHLAPDKLQGLAHEMAWALEHPCIDGFQYYETANFTTLTENGTVAGSDELRELAERMGMKE